MKNGFSKHLLTYFTCLLVAGSSLYANDESADDKSVEGAEVGTRPIPQEIIDQIRENELTQEQEPFLEEGREIQTHANGWTDSWDTTEKKSGYQFAEFNKELKLVRLSDGSRWKVSPGDFDHLEGYGWEKGQGVRIEKSNQSWVQSIDPNYTSDVHYIYRLVNLSNHTSAKVLLELGGANSYLLKGTVKATGQASLNNGTTYAIHPNDLPLFAEWVAEDSIIIGSIKFGWFDFFKTFNTILINVDSNHYVRAKQI